MALDEPRDSDSVYDYDQVSYLIEEKLLGITGDIVIDFVDTGMQSGFHIASSKPIAGSCSPGGACSPGGSCSV